MHTRAFKLTYRVGGHLLPVTVTATNEGIAHKVALPVLREGIGDPTYSNFPVSVERLTLTVGASAAALNPEVVPPLNKRRATRTRSSSSVVNA
jgi:hypothetical protein